MRCLTHHKNNLFPAWPDSLYPLWLQSLRFSSAHPFCFIPDRYTLCWMMVNTSHANVTSLTPHLHKEIADRTHSISELTTRMELPGVKVKLLSMQRPFSNWAGSLAISNHLPMNCEDKSTQELKGKFRTQSVKSMNKSTYFSPFQQNVRQVANQNGFFHQLGKVIRHTPVPFYFKYNFTTFLL